MSMVKVDPKLYGTCRLCLEDLGQYVIIPKVQEQIKYCFDIIVEPFDGMPQLLCKNCERILSEYFEIKKKFILKQNDLLNNIIDRNERQQRGSKETIFDKKDSTTSLNKELEKSSPSCIREELLSTCVNNISATVHSKSDKNKNDSNISISWPSGYKKQFACRLCNYLGRHKTNMIRHIDTSHKSLKKKHQHFFKKTSQVKIEKLDRKPNLTGVKNTVVINNDKIIQDVDRNYYIIYSSDPSKKNGEQCHDSDNESVVKKRKKTLVSLNESLNSEKRKSPRLSKTAEHNKTETFIDCICIDDSSDSAPEEPNKQSELNNTVDPSKDKVVDFTEEKIAIIKDIISACHTKHKENITLHPNESHTKSQLKHKVLSIGRKIINKQGFNCTGLLRYMEHRNLEILWTPYTANSISDSNFVRIMTKLRGHKDDDDELGWKTLAPNIEVEQDSVLETKLPDMQAIVQCKKLLNENPVANPKQMPRKSVVTGKNNETVIPSATTNNSTNSSNHTNNASTQASEPSDCTLSMPVIDSSGNTNTKPKENCDTESPSNKKNNEAELSAARIKVKPLSELLGNKGLNNFSNIEPHGSTLLSLDVQQNNLYTGIFSPNNTIPTTHAIRPNQIFQVNQMVSESQTAQPSLLASFLLQPQTNANTEERMVSAVPPTHTEYVIMDTADLPNAKTHSPVNYVKTLLHMHNIHLLDKKEDFTSKPTCLIRFKVLYKQESVDDQIVLSLSLLCHRNKFCMHVENANQEKVVLNSISANWQWEIIRVFTGEVAKILLLNALKVNQETHDCAKTFLCLIKSIKYLRH